MKKILSLVLLGCCVIVFLTGCQKTPEKKSVIQKSTSAMLKKESQNKSTINNLGANISDIAKQSNVDYLQNAEMSIGDIKSLPIYETKDATFTQDQADAFLKVAAGSKTFYKYNTGWDRDRYKHEIKMIKEQISATKCGDEVFEETGKTYKETLQEYKKAYENLGKDGKGEKGSKQFVKTVDNGQSIFGYITKDDGTKRIIQICNNNYVASPMFPTHMAFVDLYDGQNTYLDYNGLYSGYKYACPGELNLSQEDARKQAEDMISKMGIKGFDWDGTCKIMCRSNQQMKKTVEEMQKHKTSVPCAYSFVFTRNINGVHMSQPSFVQDVIEPIVTESSSDKGSDSKEALKIQSDYQKKLDYECINILVNDRGVVSFNWNGPYEVGKAVKNDAHILPLKDLVEALKTYVSNISAESADYYTAKYNVKKVIVTYQRIQEEGSDDTTLLVPVWNFFGDCYSKTKMEDDNGKKYTLTDNDKDFIIWTLNAIDGSEVKSDNGLG